MSIRAAFVDDMLINSNITDLVSNRIFDVFYDFEDFLNSSANLVGRFPALVIEESGFNNELNLDYHDNMIVGSLSITALHQVNMSRLRSRSGTVRAKFKTNLRVLDTLSTVLIDYLNTRIGTIGGYYLRRVNVDSAVDGIFSNEDNRNIISKEISYSITYSKT